MPEAIRSPARREDALAVDLALGVLAKTLGTVGVVARPMQALGRPVVHLVLRPPLVPRGLRPATWLGRAARRGKAYRSELQVDVDDLLDRLVPAVVTRLLGHVDLDHLVKENLDVATLAQDVITDIDLPAIIRSSTGVVASESLLGVRMQSISGDDAIGRAMDRMRLRLGRRVAQPRDRRTVDREQESVSAMSTLPAAPSET